MKCPNCGAEMDATAKFCTECGAVLKNENSSGAPQAAKLATNTGIVLGKKAREARLAAAVDPDAIVSDRTYNTAIVVVLLWGLLVNYLLCRFVGKSVMSINPIVLLVGYLVLVIAGTIIAAKSRNPWISFLGYNMVVVPFGLVIAMCVEHYGGINSAVVTNAFLYTVLISVGMMACVMIAPGFFAKIGGALGAVLIGLIVCEVVLLILGVKQSVTDWIAAGLFSLYIGYDIYRSQQFPKTLDNAVDSALDIYMDIANLFIRILEILGKKDN